MSDALKVIANYILAIGYIILAMVIFTVIANWIASLNRPRQFASAGAKLDRQERAIYQHLRYVGPNLRQRYGAKRAYTPAQVREALSYSGSSGDYDCYALAIYCDAPDFNEYHRSMGESCNYNLMRSEVSHSFESLFHGSTNFDACDAIDYSTEIDRAPEVAEIASHSAGWFELFGSSDSHSGGHSGVSDSHSHSDFGGGDAGGDFGGGD